MSPVTKRHQSQHVFAAEDADDDILSHLQNNNVPGPVQGGEGGWKPVFIIYTIAANNFLCQGRGTLAVSFKSLPNLHVSSSPSSSYKAITWNSNCFLGLLWWFVTATEYQGPRKTDQLLYIAKIKLEQIPSYVVCATDYPMPGRLEYSSPSSGCCGLLHSLYIYVGLNFRNFQQGFLTV